MSIEARTLLCGRLIFQQDSQRADLMDPAKTRTQLIALLLGLTEAKGWFIEVTAVRSDHRDDSALGLHSHANGYAVDCWPLMTNTPGNYYAAGDAHFADFLRDCSESPWLSQIGLAGSAQTSANVAASGRTVFDDDGADHIHLGANGP